MSLERRASDDCSYLLIYAQWHLAFCMCRTWTVLDILHLFANNSSLNLFSNEKVMSLVKSSLICLQSASIFHFRCLSAWLTCSVEIGSQVGFLLLLFCIISCFILNNNILLRSSSISESLDITQITQKSLDITQITHNLVLLFHRKQIRVILRRSHRTKNIDNPQNTEQGHDITKVTQNRVLILQTGQILQNSLNITQVTSIILIIGRTQSDIHTLIITY